MSAIITENNKIVFVDNNNNKNVLLDTINPLINNSSLPSQKLLEDGQFIYPLLNQISAYFDEFDEISKNIAGEEYKLDIKLAFILVIKELIKSNRDIKVLEIGCDKGVLSYFLAKILKLFNIKNKLVCVTDSIGNQNENYWLDKITLSNAGEIVSLLTSDYNSTFLKDNYFDIVIISGAVHYTDPALVIRNAINYIKNSGLLICVPEDQYLLASCLQITVDNCTEYLINSKYSVFTKTIDNTDK